MGSCTEDGHARNTYMHTYLFLDALSVVVTSATAKTLGFLGGKSPPHTRHDTADPAVAPWGGHGHQGLRQPSPEASKAFCAKNTSSSSWGPALYICGTAESPGQASGTGRQGSTDRWARNELVQPPLCWRSPRPPAAELCHTHASQKWRRVSRSHLWNLRFVKAF